MVDVCLVGSETYHLFTLCSLGNTLTEGLSNISEIATAMPLVGLAGYNTSTRIYSKDVSGF